MSMMSLTQHMTPEHVDVEGWAYLHLPLPLTGGLVAATAAPAPSILLPGVVSYSKM